MNGPVEIVFRGRDVVVEFPGNVRKTAVHQTEHGIAVFEASGHDAHRPKIEHLIERQLFAFHLSMDAYRCASAARTPRRHAGVSHHLLERTAQRGDVVLALGALLGERGGDAAVVVGLQKSEREILELHLSCQRPSRLGERREDLAGLERQALARRGMNHPSRH
jgi:hypothetical protein